MSTIEIMGRLNQLDYIMEKYEKRNACNSREYAELSKEYGELSKELDKLGVKRPIW